MDSRGGRSNYAVAAAVVLCLVLLGHVALRIASIEGRIGQALAEAHLVTTLTSEWTSGGIKRTLTTTREAGESAADFANRHKEEVEAALEVFPKDE